MSPPYIAFMSRHCVPTCHRDLMHGLRLLGRMPDSTRQGFRRHHLTRTLFYTQQSRATSGTFSRLVAHRHQRYQHHQNYHSSSLLRQQHATTTEQRESVSKNILAPRRRRTNANFTEQEDAKILEMRLEGATWKEIGDAIGYEANVCHYRYRRFLDPQLRIGWSEASKEKLSAMVERREPWNKIAIELNLAPQVCREKWMEINRPKVLMERMAKLEERRLARKKALEDAIANGDRRETSRQRWTPTLDALLLELQGRGWTWRQIGKAFGVVPIACYNRYNMTLLTKLKSGWTPPALNENLLPYFLRKNAGSRHHPVPPGLALPKDLSENLGSRWYAMQQMARILDGTLDATQQPTDGTTPQFTPEPPSSTSLSIGDEFPASGARSMQADRRVWSKEEDEAILRLQKEGYSSQAIARILGIRPRQVSARFHILLDQDLHRGWTPHMLDRLEFFVRQGLSWTTIASNLGRKASVCKAQWQDLQRRLKPSSVAAEEESAEHPSSQLSPTSLPPSPVVASTANSSATADDSQGQPSSQGQSQNTQQDAWNEETAVSRGITNGYDGADLVDEYDNEDQDDHAEDFEEDDYFGGDEDDEDDEDDDSSLLFDQERDVAGTSSRRRKTKGGNQLSRSSSTSPHSLPSNYWDQNAVLRAIAKNWTLEEETALIQHVLKHGPRGWDKISQEIRDGRAKRLGEQLSGTSAGDLSTDPLSGHAVLRHEHFSAEECQAYWKHLDLPVRRQAVDDVGQGTVQQVFEGDKRRMARFWQLWLELGSDFDRIASRLSEDPSWDENASSADNVVHVTAAQCRDYFDEKTKSLHQTGSRVGASTRKQAPDSPSSSLLSTPSAGAENGMASEADVHNQYVALAKTLAEEPKFHWTKERSVRLQKLVRQRLRTRGVQLNWINWKWVARHIGDGVSPTACSCHWRSLRQISAQQQHQRDTESEGPASSVDAPWSEQEVLLLEQGVREVGVGDNAINGPTMFLRTLQRFYLPHRPVLQIQKKYFTLSDKAMEVTLDEYLAIMEAVDEVSKETVTDPALDLENLPVNEVVQELYAPSSHLWDKVIQRMSKMHQISGWTKAPARRVFESSYQHYVKFKASTWTRDEDQDLVQVVQWLSPADWLSVARFFPDRSSWECRLRWCSLVDEIDLTKAPPAKALSV